MESLSSDELNKLNTIKAELVKEKILFDDEWLIGVLRSLRAFQASSNVNSKHVLRKWMNTDLAAMGISKSTIPDEAYSSRGYTIDDDLTLQVIYCTIGAFVKGTRLNWCRVSLCCVFLVFLFLAPLSPLL